MKVQVLKFLDFLEIPEVNSLDISILKCLCVCVVLGDDFLELSTTFVEFQKQWTYRMM